MLKHSPGVVLVSWSSSLIACIRVAATFVVMCFCPQLRNIFESDSYAVSVLCSLSYPIKWNTRSHNSVGSSPLGQGFLWPKTPGSCIPAVEVFHFNPLMKPLPFTPGAFSGRRYKSCCACWRFCFSICLSHTICVSVISRPSCQMPWSTGSHGVLPYIGQNGDSSFFLRRCSMN